jgi:hypothetical protein
LKINGRTNGRISGIYNLSKRHCPEKLPILGELLASQLYSYMTANITPNQSLVGEKAVGNYLRENVFLSGPGIHGMT